MVVCTGAPGRRGSQRQICRSPDLFPTSVATRRKGAARKRTGTTSPAVVHGLAKAGRKVVAAVVDERDVDALGGDKVRGAGVDGRRLGARVVEADDAVLGRLQDRVAVEGPGHRDGRLLQALERLDLAHLAKVPQPQREVPVGPEEVPGCR